jgi:hypothetical protein
MAKTVYGKNSGIVKINEGILNQLNGQCRMVLFFKQPVDQIIVARSL